MVMTDPIADYLTRIRNANVSRKSQVEVPASKMKIAISQILADEGYIKGFEVEEDNKQNTIRIFMKYGQNKEHVITNLKRISKPGLRVYAKYDELPKVLNGLGIAIISTSEGILTDREAREKQIGGEVLAYVW